MLLDLGNANLLAIVKWSRDRRERALIIINKDRSLSQSFSTHLAGQFMAGASHLEDLSPDGPLKHTADFQTCTVASIGNPRGMRNLGAKARKIADSFWFNQSAGVCCALWGGGDVGDRT